MRKLLRFAWLLPVLLSTHSRAATPARKVYPVVDLHVDLSYQYNFKRKSFPDNSGQFSVRAMRQGGVAGVVLPLFIPRDASATGPRAADLESSYERVNLALEHSSVFAPAGCASPNSGVRTFFAFEGAGPLAAEPERLATWQRRGLRIVGLVHTFQNQLASSSGDPAPPTFGLTPLGRAFVKRAFELGLVVDVSHASDRAVDEILALAEGAHGVVVATHSNARALADHRRNLKDDQLRAIARTGGVVGVNFHGPFLTRARHAHLKDVVAQIQYLVKTAGIEHVAIGSDFEGDISPPPELADASRFPRLSAALAEAGFADGEIQKIFADNALRVLCPPSEAKAVSVP